MRARRAAAAAACALLAAAPRIAGAQPAPAWPAVTREARPWTRWWWMGSAVAPADLTAALEAYRRVGLGGVEVTPIYGVRGHEDAFVPYLSPAWTRLLAHTLREARRLDLGVDMATGTGWPFGGPWVGADAAARYAAWRSYSLRAGERLPDTVRYVQEPVLRTQAPAATRIEIGQLVDPVAANPDLQRLALDQVRFPKPIPLQALVAYPAGGGRPLDVTSRVGADGVLDWTAPAAGAPWTLHALFVGWHGKLVERAAPGGEGNVVDHFSGRALRAYLQRFDRAFAAAPHTGLRAFFNDSYEVDDARGQADWTPRLLDEFRARRGYDLRDELPALLGRADADRAARVRADYRETIADLLLDEFTVGWRNWAHGRRTLVRDQAHGSPGSLLDLYAASDIPETEGDDLLGIKVATSAAHVAGRRLASAEAATWLGEHFTSTLADVRAAVDRLLLGGVNHVFYHGTAYSPRAEPWPGWLFYAAVHFQPTAPWWDDFGALNRYVGRAQAFLQTGTPANDVLLYFPIHDRFAETAGPLLEHFDQGGARSHPPAMRAVAARLQARGFAFDYVSDRQLAAVRARAGAPGDGALHTGGATYRAVVIPATRHMPPATLARVVELARGGAAVIVDGPLPDDVPGLGDLARRRAALRAVAARLRLAPDPASGAAIARVGRGVVLVGGDVERMLARAGVRREPMVDAGVQYVRRRHARGYTYFVVNGAAEPVDGWVPLAVAARSAALFDPMTGRSGAARLRPAAAGGVDVLLQLPPGESRVVQTFDAPPPAATRAYPYLDLAGPPLPIAGPWTVRFVAGGPVLPAAVRTDSLASWTDFGGEEVRRFAGTATYAATVAPPGPADGADAWLLDLGRVCETARVRLDGADLGTLIGPRFQLVIDGARLRRASTLEVSVSNSMANRIADMDRRGVAWKRFYNINFPARLPENRGSGGLFDASRWAPRCSGLLGPVTLTPARRRPPNRPSP